MTELKFARESHARRDHMNAHGTSVGGLSRCDFRPHIFVQEEKFPPLPSVADYDEWLLMAKCKNARDPLPGCKLRRAVIMSRRHETFVDIGRAVGMSGAGISYWLKKLPEHLR